MDRSIFRSYDIRGGYPDKINEKTVFYIASQLGAVFKKGKIVVGHDARLSSPSLYKSLIQGLETAGFKVISVGLVTTPMVAFFARHFHALGGITVTASHNPKNDNGLDVIRRNGISIGGKELLQKLGVKSLKLEARRTEGQIKEVPKRQVLYLYTKFLEKLFGVKKPIKIVIDCSNGTAGSVIEKLSFPENVETILLNTKSNGNFPAHGPNPIIGGAQKQAAVAIAKHRADLGVVFDSDGDRALFLDNKGKIIKPEYLWRLLITNSSLCTAVFSVTETYMMHLINRELVNNGLKYKLVESKVGHLSMRKECAKQKSAIGLESSMHYYFPDDRFAGCAILAMIKTINALSRLPYLLSNLVSFLPQTIRLPEISKRYRRNRMGQLYKAVVHRFVVEKRIYYKDGLSVLGSNWWFNIRPSNTEDEVRINIESDKTDRAQELKKKLLDIL